MIRKEKSMKKFQSKLTLWRGRRLYVWKRLMIDKKLGLVLVAAMLAAGCNSCQQNQNANAPANANQAVAETVTTPPFQTKEPPKYQAQVVITTVLVGNQAAPVGPPLGSVTQFIARDGDKRRLEYDYLPGVRVAVLSKPEGEFLLYPAEKIYAEVKPEKPKPGKTPAGEESLEDFSPDKLLNPQLPGAKYEKLGAEAVNGRAATKYRSAITVNGKTNETLIWVDDELGIPVKEESESATEGTRRTLEYREIKTEVAPTLFDIPAGWQKVAQAELQRRVSPRSANLGGRDRDEKTHDETHLKDSP
jgi:hypothetical protein